MNSQKSASLAHFVVLLILSCALTLPFLGRKPFYSTGEPREALVAQQMLASGNWILPKRYGDDIATKPPLAHWLMGLVSLPGAEVTEQTSRLPSAILSILAVLAFYMAAAKGAGARTALLAALLLLGGAEWHRASVTARVDMTLAAFTVLALLTLHRWSEKGGRILFFWSIVLLTAAALSKGPVGIVLPLGAAGLYMLLRRKPVMQTIGACFSAAIIAGAAASIWYVLAYRAGGQEFLETVRSENIGRFTGTMKASGKNPHSHSIFYLYGTVLLGMLPWTGVVLFPPLRAWAVRGFRRLRGLLQTENSFYLFSFVVICVFAAFYSIPPSKRSVYLLPIYPFLCLFAAELMQFLGRSFPRREKAAHAVVAGMVAALFLALAVLMLLTPNVAGLFHGANAEEILYYQQVLADLASRLSLWETAIMALPLVLALMAFSSAARVESMRYFSIFSVLAALLAFEAVLSPHFASALTGREFAAQIRPLLRPEEKVYSYKVQIYTLDFYLEGRIAGEDPADYPEEGCVVLLRRKDADALAAEMDGKFQAVLLAESAHGIQKPRDVFRAVRLQPAQAS